MTEQVYETPLESYDTGIEAKPTRTIPVMKEGRAALEKINEELGLSFDSNDLDYYTAMFREQLKRDPTDVEVFDVGQSNSEHSRHWFFGGKMIIDGVEKKETLFQMVKSTLPKDKPTNSVIAFHDNSSAIKGFPISTLRPQTPGKPSPMVLTNTTQNILLTAETHNFPSGVAPFPGAETGTGGRIRDVQATGRGAHVVAGTVAYCVGNLHIPGYKLPWEEECAFEYPNNLATPLQIEVSASNGASDYGNKFGEPVITGFTRSFGQRLPNGERREYVKPIMFTAGVGQLDAEHIKKGHAEPGMEVVKMGGPCYRIGIGGGAASSRVQDEKTADLDFNAVQRGDAEMENKMNRVIRACIELGDKNPIVAIHDQGAGGNGNVLKEICEPAGAVLELRNIPVGDDTLSVMEIWGAEYQENNAMLCKSDQKELLSSIAEREHSSVAFLGKITGDGKVIVHDAKDDTTPFNLDLELVLGKLPQKTFKSNHVKQVHKALSYPSDLTVDAALDRVLRLLSVGSKRFLTNKVDRSVTGLIAQQQCVGPLHTPLANCAVFAQSHFGVTGAATAIGEQPIKGLINTAAMARLTVGEALTNIMWARITQLEDIKASGNWMWAAKMEGEGAVMYDCCQAMSDSMKALGISIDGGKDSLSMAARVGKEVVKAPGTLVLSVYAAVPDVTLTVTPDLKAAGSTLLYVDLSKGKGRLGGTAFAQVFNQIGNDVPDMEHIPLVAAAFKATQKLLDGKKILSGHDRSDGGLLTTLLEMAFAGNMGWDISVTTELALMNYLFSEELGFVIEVEAANVTEVKKVYKSMDVDAVELGHVTKEPKIVLKVNGKVQLKADMRDLRTTWEATSFQLERLQTNPACVEQEEASLYNRTFPPYKMTYDLVAPDISKVSAAKDKPLVAILREEGSHGDREMTSAFYAAGFEPWDVHVSDLVSGRITMDKFRGVVFVGGFSYADVLDSAKGWAGVIKFNEAVWDQFQEFYKRPDTFSLGVCNGCQLMALLGWVPFGSDTKTTSQPRFIRNNSGRFESRYSTVTIQDSPAIMLDGMSGSTLGVWVAHGEGRLHFPDESIKDQVMEAKLAPIRYVDDSNTVTEAYPFNPNGSVEGIAALCSPDGRHLAMMPHPERCITTWQQPYKPKEWSSLECGPWIRMFQNAKWWCDSSAVDVPSPSKKRRKL
jgi:phosphoribosylformylglycinamidine synthase